MKVIPVFLKILKILIFSSLIIFSSCLDLEAELIPQGERFDLSLVYSVPQYMGHLSFSDQQGRPFFLPLSQEEWISWEESLNSEATGSFRLEEKSGLILIQINMVGVDSETMNQILPVQITQGINELTIQLGIISEEDLNLEAYPFNESQLFHLYIREPAPLTAFGGGDYDEEQKRVQYVLSMKDFVLRTESILISMEW